MFKVTLFTGVGKGETVKAIKLSVSVLSVVVLLAFAALAEVKVEMKAEKVTVQMGKESMSSADQAAPGDVLQLTATYKNTDKTPVKQVLADIKIDPREEYVPGTAKPAGVMASTDGVKFSPLPLKRMVKNSAGKMVEQEVPASEFKVLRWTLDLAGGESRAVSARMKLRTAPAAR